MERWHGRTFPQFLFGIAAASLLASLAIATSNGMAEQHRAEVVADHFQAELAFARNEAMLRRKQVVVCRTRDFRNCVYSGVWSTGLMTFEDRNYDRDLTPGEPLLGVRNVDGFDGFHLVGSLNRQVIDFQPDGRSTGGSSTTLRLCAKSLEALRLLVIHASGRIRSAKAGGDTPACGSD